MFLFTDDCLLGVEQIDEEHRHLFDLLNQGINMLNNDYREDFYTDIKELLDELEDYADQHFTHEEKYMEEIRDPELILQREQHISFRERILEFQIQNIDDEESQHEMLEELMNYLARWLYHHIISSDMLIGKLPPLEEWMVKENPCEFSEDYEIGVPIIDKEHRMLFELIERAYHLVRSGHVEDKIDLIMEVLGELKEYTKFHFSDEEEYMRDIGYEGLDAQKRAHEAFVARLEEINEGKMHEDPQTYMETLIAFLLSWLVNHILKADKDIPLITA